MVERPVPRALFDDDKRRVYGAAVIAAAVSGGVWAVLWVWARDLDPVVRGVVGLSAAATGVLLVLSVTWATRRYPGAPAIRHDGTPRRSLAQTLTRTMARTRTLMGMEKPATTAFDSTRVRVERPVTGAEWMQIATEFEHVRDLRVRAEWHKDPDGESWSLGGSMPAALGHTRELCTRAGVMLLGSPRVAAALSERVRAHADPVDRWLQYIREQPQARMQVLDMSHTIAIPIEGGYIRDVPTVSARACIACSTDEF
jgi:hypothetical protein